MHSSPGGLVGLEGLGSKQYQLSPRKLKGCQKKKKNTQNPKTYAPYSEVAEGPPDNHLV